MAGIRTRMTCVCLCLLVDLAAMAGDTFEPYPTGAAPELARDAGAALEPFAKSHAVGHAQSLVRSVRQGRGSTDPRVSKNKYISGVRAPELSLAKATEIKEAGRRRIVIKPEDLTAKEGEKMTDWS